VCGTDRAEGVILVERRDTENGHHRVADELLDGAAVPLNDLADLAEVASQEAARRLGIRPLTAAGGAHHVREEDRDGLAHFAGGGCGGCQRRRAIQAEARSVGVLLTAARAPNHARQCTSRTNEFGMPRRLNWRFGCAPAVTYRPISSRGGRYLGQLAAICAAGATNRPLRGRKWLGLAGSDCFVGRYVTWVSHPTAELPPELMPPTALAVM